MIFMTTNPDGLQAADTEGRKEGRTSMTIQDIREPTGSCNIPTTRFRPFRITRIVTDTMREKNRCTEEKRETDEKRRESTLFNIRVQRAVALIARSRCTTRHACRCVGLKIGTKSECAVKTACDRQRILRWRASPTCRAVLQISLPYPSPQAKARPRRFAMTTHVPSPAFVDSPARRKAASARRRLHQRRHARTEERG
jgi:hypothetical protein